MLSASLYRSGYFYPRPPRGGRHNSVPYMGLMASISIHALREEGDRPAARADRREVDFYPRPPRGGRPASRWSRRKLRSYFYPRPPRGGRLGWKFDPPAFEEFLSTPSARRATLPALAQRNRTGISIHALREEGDITSRCPWTTFWIFLSTPSARRATHSTDPAGGKLLFLSTPSARRATLSVPTSAMVA